MLSLKKNVFAAVQPSGTITIGNYYGAIKKWVELQDKFNCSFSVADFHSLSIRQTPKIFNQNILRTCACLIACGLSPQKSTLFVQSDVAAHAELSQIINCHLEFDELFNLDQFRFIKSNYAQNLVNSAIFTYPSLMAADILLYNTNLVPVGEDQRQHVELAKIIAKRFNKMYGKIFTSPEPLVPKTGSQIMSLQNPSKKMSKSDKNELSRISIFDDENTITSKFSSAFLDSPDGKLSKDALNNLAQIYFCATGKKIQMEKDHKIFKKIIAKAVYEDLKPIQENFSVLIKNEDRIKKCYKEGSDKAKITAEKTLKTVKEKLGFIS
ncbi:MAG: tryptophan--tRNA ligase [Oscillospiraceae bacterium]|nr:tryptophan--tRNA ligase [Oscillospiraceae bacterium]